MSNIPQQTTAEDIVIYFQKRRNGGGDIDHVYYITEKGSAVIVYDSIEVVNNVLEYSHKLGGSELRLQRFIPKEPSEVFQQVEARVNFETFHIPPKDSQNMLELLKENTKVEVRNRTGNCILAGTFNQIDAARKFLQHLIEMHFGKNAIAIHRHDDTTSTQKDSSRASDGAETNSFEVQPQFMNLLKQVYNSKLQSMEETFGVKILWEENASQVRICRTETSQEENRFQEGCDAFIDLYQKFHPNMRREEVELPHGADEAQIIEAISRAQAENRAIFEKVQNNIVVYAEKESISTSVHALKEKLALDGSNRKTRRGQKRSSLDVHDRNEAQQRDRFPQGQRLNQRLENGVRLSLYQGDITDEQVDAIVNAANECLQHGAGVAGAIVRKGGHQIQDESNWITSRYGSVNVGKAVYTSGGILPCNYVIHAVGPKWNDHGREKCISLLREACLESLHVAAELEVFSIALTAISSGIFGMPKDICAQVMFQAVEEFSASDVVNFSTLRDVRIVIIDEPTLRIFQQEFVKRYRSKGDTSEATISREKSSYTEKEPLKSNENKSVHQTQRRDEIQLGEKTKPDIKTEPPTSVTGREEESPDQLANPTILTNNVNNIVQSTENAKTGSLPATSTKGQNLQAGGTNLALKGDNSAPLKNGSKEIKSTSSMKLSCRPSCNLAATFSKPLGKENPTPNESAQVQGKNANAGTEPATTTTSPPGLNVTEEGKQFARNHSDGVESDESKNITRENEADNIESRRPSLLETNQSQQSEHGKQNVDGEIAPFNHDHPSVNNLSPEENIKNSDKVIAEPIDRSSKDQASLEERSKKVGLNSESDMVSDETVDKHNSLVSKTAVKKLQTSNEGTVKGETTKGLNSSSGNQASPQGVVEVDDNVLGESREADGRPSQSVNSGPPPLNEMRKSHQTSEPNCLMCMNLNKYPVEPWHCNQDHYFCVSCIKTFLEKTGICLQCQKESISEGSQPIGWMTWNTLPETSLPGYENCGIITIYFKFDGGIQGPEHPNPGQPYSALFTTVYLPGNADGYEACSLLKKAFEMGLLFTIGKCLTTGEENQIVWNGIELKTTQTGGPASYGYPDPSYLDRLKNQLTEKGITHS